MVRLPNKHLAYVAGICVGYVEMTTRFIEPTKANEINAREEVLQSARIMMESWRDHWGASGFGSYVESN